MKVHILGGPGSGKSTMAATLAAQTGAPHVNLDDIYWGSDESSYGQRAVDAPLRLQTLSDRLKADTWIVEGVYHDWVDESLQGADCVVYLRTAFLLRCWRLLKRELRRTHGPARFTRTGSLLFWNISYQLFHERKVFRKINDLVTHVVYLHSSDVDSFCRMVVRNDPIVRVHVKTTAARAP